jgi:LacI family transcriptional regulator, gluconate utilization system Gnt-I transcriptional repressor
MKSIKQPGRFLNRKSNITLAEVAKLANVSEITVSRVMRNKGPISKDTRKIVMTAVKKTGYVPNRIAGSLASARSNIIGVAIPSLSNIVFPEVLRGIHAALQGTDYQPVVGVTDYNIKTEESFVRSIMAWKPAAMIMAGFDHTDAARKILVQSGIRVAELMDIDPKPIDIAVGLSHRQAGYDTGRYLIERGYRRFGYVGHNWLDDKRAKLRYDGLAQALTEAGLGIVAHAQIDGPSSMAAGRNMTAQLLAGKVKVDVAVYSNDDMAVGGVFHCLSAGVAIREKLAIFGFNGLDIGAALPMALSTLRSNRFLIGKIAVEKLLENLEHRTKRMVIDTGYEIIAGETA